MPAGETSSVITGLTLPGCVPVSAISDPRLRRHDIRMHVLRLDLIDPVLSGNKVFKLIPNLIHAKAAGFNTVLSFGGAYSNHLHALAEAGQRFGVNTIAVVRGDDGQPDSHTLQFARSRGMRLIRVSRQDYRRRRDADFIAELRQRCGEFYLLPEGGGNVIGSQGCMQLATVMMDSLQNSGALSGLPDEILLPCGTGTTMAGLIAGLGALHTCSVLPAAQRLPHVCGIAVLKQGQVLLRDINNTLTQLGPLAASVPPWSLETSYHWGGYAKYPQVLADFVRQFEAEQGFLLDPVYTAKMVSAAFDRVESGLYPPGTHLLLLHTGGLQGRLPLMD